jgi:hypothetical protein
VARRDPIGLISSGVLQVALCACLAAFLATPPAALASPPSVTITSPADGAVSNDRTPVFSGLTDLESGTVILRIYAGTVAEGNAVQKLPTGDLTGGNWTVHVARLEDGVYTAQASQTNAELQTGSSPPVTFTITTAAPTVTLNPPEPAPGVTEPAFTGTATDTMPVTVEIYAEQEGTLVSSATAAGTGEGWRSSNANPSLAVGQYKAVAFQESSLAGNPEGESQPVTFSIRPAPAVLTPPLIGGGVAAAVTAKAPEAAPRLTLMAPFPVVRIAGVVNRTGARLQLLRVQQLPAGAQVQVRCSGHGCPPRASRRLSVLGRLGVEPLTFRGFERSLGAGAVLQVFISKPGQIGKYTRFKIRRGRLPERVDTCLDPTGTKPEACPPG